MSFRKRNKDKKKDLQKQTEKSQKNKDQKGIFLKYYKTPEGLGEWRPKEGNHIFDVVPFNAGKNHPQVVAKEIKEGTLVYKVEVWVHQNIGSKKEPIVCPYNTFGRDCPICAYVNANYLPKDEWQKVAAKRRVIYLVWVHSDAELEKKGVILWETSHHNAEKKFLDAAKNPRTGGSIIFSDVDEGQSLYFEIKGTKMNQEWSAHKCIPRDGDGTLPDKILDQMGEDFHLEDIIDLHPTVEYIEQAFTGQRIAIGKVLDNEPSETNEDNSGDDVPFEDGEEKESLSPKKDKKDKKDKKKKKDNNKIKRRN